MKPILLSPLFFIFILALSYLRPLAAQTIKADKNRLSVHFGYHVNRSQDLVFSPMIYEGSSAGVLGLSYQRLSERGFHRLEFGYDNVEVRSTEPVHFTVFGERIDRRLSKALQMSINYGYARSIKSGEKVHFYAGGLLETKIHLTRYHFGVSEDEGYVFANSLNPWLGGEYRLGGKSFIQAEIHLPLLSWISRSEYAIVDNEEIQYEGSDVAFLYVKGELASLGTHQALNASLSYRLQFASAMCFNFTYRFDYLRFKKPLPIAVLKNNFDFGLSFNF